MVILHNLQVDGWFLWEEAIGRHPAMRLTKKLWKVLCLECSTCSMFFSSSLIVSISTRLRNRILPATLICAPFMLFLSLVMSCMPSTKRCSKSLLLIYPLSSTSLPDISVRKRLFSRGILSSVSPRVMHMVCYSIFSLQTTCSLKPKNHPMEHISLAAMPLNTLCM